MTLSDGTSFVDSSAPGIPGLRFAGFTSDTPISSFTLLATNDSWVVDGVTLASKVPEPGTMAMFGLALAAAGLTLRRRTP
jgi:hypothetical protein